MNAKFSALATTLIVSASVLTASADVIDRPSGFKIGERMTLRPYVSLSYTYDSNVDSTKHAKDGSSWVVNPGLGAEYKGENWEIAGRAWYRYHALSLIHIFLAWTRGFFWKGPMWPRNKLAEHCGDLQGTTAVIAGFGRIGRAIAARLEPFGVECSGITRHGIFTLENFHEGRSTTDIRQSKALGPLLRRADWFIIALPSDTNTDDFLDARLIRRLPKKCVVVNVGRGNAVDEDALLSAIREGRLAGAYLDVFKHEPTALNPTIGPRGKGLAAAKSVPRNLVRMPHACAFSSRYMKECFQELAREGVLK